MPARVSVFECNTDSLGRYNRIEGFGGSAFRGLFLLRIKGLMRVL
jgi:hypothetical protein